MGATEADKAAVAEAVRETGFRPEPQGLAATPMPGTADDDADDEPTAEEMAAIDRDPRLRETYRSIVRREREASGRLDRQRQEAEAAIAAVETIRARPRESIRAMAQMVGGRLEDEPPAQTTKDRVRSHLASKIGQEAADVLGPVLLEAVDAIAGEKLAPFEQERAARAQAENQQALGSEVAAFAQRVVEEGGEWNEGVEREMAAVALKAPPGPNVTLPEYLTFLHNAVTAKRGRTSRKAPKESRAAIRPGMDPKEAVRIAVASARRELGQ